MINNIVIVGAGGLGKEILWQLKSQQCKIQNKKYNITGFADDSKQLQGKEVNGCKVIGDTDCLVNGKEKLSVITAIGSSNIRKKVINKLKQNPNLVFPNFISQKAIVSDDVMIGEGCIICMSSIISVNVKLGDYVISNMDSIVGHDCIIQDFVTLYPSVNVSGNVTIQALSEIGTGTQIIQGKVVGEKCVVGAGAVVNKNIPNHTTAVGVPAKVIKQHT